MHLLLDVFVPGAPKTKGSVEAIGTFMPKVKRAIAALKRGNVAAALRELESITGRTYVKQSVTGSTHWAKMMEYAVAQAWGDREPYAGAVRTSLTYWLPVTDEEALIKQGSGDIDKLERNVLDALTKAGVYVDDAQVVGCLHEKAVAGVQGVRIQVWSA